MTMFGLFQGGEGKPLQVFQGERLFHDGDVEKIMGRDYLTGQDETVAVIHLGQGQTLRKIS